MNLYEWGDRKTETRDAITINILKTEVKRDRKESVKREGVPYLACAIFILQRSSTIRSTHQQADRIN